MEAGRWKIGECIYLPMHPKRSKKVKRALTDSGPQDLVSQTDYIENLCPNKSGFSPKCATIRRALEQM